MVGPLGFEPRVYPLWAECINRYAMGPKMVHSVIIWLCYIVFYHAKCEKVTVFTAKSFWYNGPRSYIGAGEGNRTPIFRLET